MIKKLIIRNYYGLALALSMASPTYSQVIPNELPPRNLECKTTEENLVGQYIVVKDITGLEGKLVRRYRDRETGERCGIEYKIHEAVPYQNKGLFVDFEKGAKIK